MLNKTILLLMCVMIMTGCSSHTRGNVGLMPVFSAPKEEAEWIRNGDPLEIEGDLWYPQDFFDVLLDSEVYLVGEYKGVQVFVNKIDVRPYDRLYTKFAQNKFRVFKKRSVHD